MRATRLQGLSLPGVQVRVSLDGERLEDALDVYPDQGYVIAPASGPSLLRYDGDPAEVLTGVIVVELRGGPPTPALQRCPLPPRQRQVLRLVVAGLQDKQIAQKLGLGATTIKSHLHRIYETLGVQGRTDAAALAVRCGWDLGEGEKQ